MNLQNKAIFKSIAFSLLKKGLLGAVILLYFSSCEDASNIGLELQESDVFGGTSFTDTLSIETSVVLLDSIVTSTASRTLVGRMDDDIFGDLTSKGFIQIILPTEDSALVFGSNEAVFDSVVLQIPSSGVFGIPSSTINYEVYELTERVDSVNYLRTDSLDFSPMPLASIAYNPEDDTLNIFRVRLDDAFGQKIFDQSGRSVLSNQSEFDALIGGIHIAPAGTDEGHVMALNPRTTGTISYLRIYYSEPGDTVSTFRTLGFGRSFHNIGVDYTGTPLEGLEVGGEISTEELGNRAFVQMGVGLTTKIRFPYIDSLKRRGNLAINRAELVFDPIEGSIEEYGNPPNSLIFLLSEGTTDTLSTNPGAVTRGVGNGVGLATANYNAGGRSYDNVTMTLFLQAIIDGAIENPNFLFGHPETVFDRFGRAAGTRPRLSNNVSLQKLVVGDSQNPDNRQMKLEIYLTTF